MPMPWRLNQEGKTINVNRDDCGTASAVPGPVHDRTSEEKTTTMATLT